MHLNRAVRVVGSAAVVAIGLLQPAAVTLAQQVGQAVLEEIVVTARKREENLMEVPLSITALSAADIENAGIKDLNTLALYTPGLWIEYGISSQLQRQLTFRGLSVSTGQVFIDGAPYTGPGNPNLGNLERVEVLVGPQSAYFGRSTFQGALNFVTKQPADKFQGQLKAEFARFDTHDMSISVEGPLLADKLAARLNVRAYNADGQWVNRSNTNQRLGGVAQKSGTVTFRFDATDNLHINGLLDYVLDTDGYTPTVALSAFGYNGQARTQSQQLFCNLGGTFGPYWCGALPTAKGLDQLSTPGTPHIISANLDITPFIYDVLIRDTLGLQDLYFDPTWLEQNGFKQQVQTGHLDIQYDTASGWTFSSLTAINRTKFQNLVMPNYRDDRSTPNPRFPATRGTLPYIGFHSIRQGFIRDTSQELRLNSPTDLAVHGTAGVNYVYSRDPGTRGRSIQPGGAVANVVTRTNNKTPALFGGVYYDVTDDLTVGAETRYQWDKIFAQAVIPTVAAPLEGTFKSLSPRVTIDYNYSEGSLVYVLWSRGYRPGGFNASAVGQPQSVLDQLSAQAGNNAINYKQEKLDNFEAGLKATWLDGRLQITADVYYDQWRDGQVSNSLSVNFPTGQRMITLTTNVGAVNLHGVEFTSGFAVSENLSVAGTINYQTSKILDYVYTPTGTRIRNSTNVNGNKFPNAPDWTWTLSPTYTDILAGSWEWYTRFDWRHRGRYYIDPTNVAWLAPSNVIDMRLGIKDEARAIEVSVTNLTNDQTFTAGTVGADATCCVTASNVNEIRVILPPRRSYGIRATYNF